MSVNKVILVGHVGKDPETKHLDKGVAVSNFPFATSESYTAKTGEKISNTEWHNIVAWRGLSEVVDKYVKKGSKLYIEGRIKTRSWDDKDGGKHYITEIYAENIELFDKREGQAEVTAQNGRAEQLQSVKEPDFNQPEEDDLPF